MAWYRRSKLALDMVRNLAFGSKHARVVSTSSCLDVVGFKKKSSSWLFRSYLVTMGIASSAAYLSNLETIPYSKRTHVILVPSQLEKALGVRALRLKKEKHERKVLPPTHPTSVRVGRVAQDLIDALQRDLRGENRNGIDVWGYWKLGARYLDHVDWEVLVVDDPLVKKAMSTWGGKIVVYTGLIKDLRSDAELAFVIGHELGHIVARYNAEYVTKYMRLIALKLHLDKFFGESDTRDTAFNLFFFHPSSRKTEFKADYIGLLLMASAGYDPHVGVKWMERRQDDCSYWAGFLESHPSSRKRAQRLSQALAEAMTFYRRRHC